MATAGSRTNGDRTLGQAITSGSSRANKSAIESSQAKYEACEQEVIAFLGLKPCGLQSCGKKKARASHTLALSPEAAAVKYCCMEHQLTHWPVHQAVRWGFQRGLQQPERERRETSGDADMAQQRTCVDFVALKRSEENSVVITRAHSMTQRRRRGWERHRHHPHHLPATGKGPGSAPRCWPAAAPRPPHASSGLRRSRPRPPVQRRARAL